MTFFNPFSKAVSQENEKTLANQYAQQNIAKIMKLDLPKKIKTQLIAAGVFDFWFDNRRLQPLIKILRDNEKIIYAAKAIDDQSHDVLIICTDQKLILLIKKMFAADQIKTIPLMEVKSVNFKKQLFYNDLTLVVKDQTVTFNSLNKTAAPILVQKMKQAIRNLTQKSANTEELNQEITQIKKLQKLVDQGILTKEEFEAKKKQILKL